MAEEFKLGPPLLRQGTDCVPLDWRDALLRHLDGPSATSFAASSKAAHDWLVREWPAATLRFRVRTADADADAEGTQLPGRFRRAQQQLSQRGTKPTIFALQQSGPVAVDWWQVALADVPTISAPPTLTLSVQLQDVPAPLLAQLGTVFSGISTVDLSIPHDRRGSTAHMPAPSALPGLRRLRVDSIRPDAAGPLWASAAPFVPQLTCLLLAEQPATPQAAQQQMCATLFSDATLSCTLTRLTLPCALTPWLTALLQQYTPRLTELLVLEISGDVGGEAGDPADVAAHCSWHTLIVNGLTFPASAWEWLPVPVEGKLAVRFDEAEGLPLPARATLSHVLMWNVTAITVWAQGLTPTEQCAALREALPLLQRMRDTVYILQEQSGQDDHYAFNVLLRDLTVTPELASDLPRYAEHWPGFALCNLQWPEDTVITTPFPHLGHLGFTNTLDDNLLAKVVTTVTSMDSSLCSPKVWLQEPVPPGTRLPFKAVSVESITVTELLDSAVKLGGGIEWQCEELVICVGPDQVACVPGWVEQLSTIRLNGVGFLQINASEERTDEAAVLRGSLALLRALPCNKQ